MIDLYPSIEPHEQGLLDVGDGNFVHWEVSGSPSGKPAVVVHGGPGQGCAPNMRRAFDPDRYRIVMFDQRGCGLSTPHASDPTTDLRFNTTEHLIRDMEQLRSHLRIDRWLLSGGSWGSTLALAYAERHASHVSEIVLSGITTGRRSESDWLYRGAARFFPEEWQGFRDGVAESDRDGDLVAAYARSMDHPDASVRDRAADAWCAWEDAVLSMEPNAPSTGYSDQTPRDRLAFVRICAHYVAHGAWLEEGALIRDAGRLRDVPGVLIHGRRDLSCPLDTAWELARAWPGAELIALSNSGHLRSDEKRAALLSALDRFARR
ncbi:MAG: prolyl aminopeptidase [Polyangiales bacterium]